MENRMIYKQYDEAVIDVITSKTDLEIVVGIRDMFTYKQTEQAIKATELATRFKVTRQKISNIIKKMVEAKLLLKIARGVYRLNPYMYLPYKANAEELQAEWNELQQGVR